MAVCSCYMCGNMRRHCGPPINEVRALTEDELEPIPNEPE